ELAALARRKDLLFCVTYTYTGYPAVKHAREMIARGDLGELRFVNAEYAQEWLATPLERDGVHKQAAWRADPKATGKALCVGDIAVSQLDEPSEILSRGRDRFYPLAQGYSRVPAGHPEGYFEAFANIYKAFTAALRKKKSGAALSPADLDFPGVEDGLSGVRFIDRCVESSRKGSAWVEV